MTRNPATTNRGRGTASDRALDSAKLSLRALEEAGASVDQVLRTLNSNRKGLTENDAQDRLRKYGKNEVSHEKPPTWGKVTEAVTRGNSRDRTPPVGGTIILPLKRAYASNSI